MSARMVFGRPMLCHMPGMVAAKLGASAEVATTPMARTSREPAAQTTAWALQDWRYSWVGLSGYLTAVFEKALVIK